MCSKAIVPSSKLTHNNGTFIVDLMRAKTQTQVEYFALEMKCKIE